MSKATKIIAQFKTFFTTYSSVSPYLNLDETTKKYIEHRHGWIKRLEKEEFPVAFFGSFSAGKSTIINAILGREVLPEATQSTTAFPTLLRSGKTDAACVYYIDEDAKDALWNQLCVEIGLKIDKRLARTPQESYNTHLQRVKAEVSKWEQSTSNQVDRTPLAALNQLSRGWNDEKYTALRKPIGLSDLKQYVEGHEDALFIDRIEVIVSNVNISDDIILVDLPGLAVANQRHVHFTKDYIQEKAKAFVVCMKPKHLLEGQEIEFLEATNRNNPTILQRSFWVINQWDTLTSEQRREEEQNFEQKVQRYGFTISRQRFFKFSALNYLLLYCIANETLYTTEKLKNHLSILEKITAPNDVDNISPEQAKVWLEHQEIKPFTDFSLALFGYLNGVAKDEFLADARAELRQLLEILKRCLDPLYNEYSNRVDIEAEFRSVEVSKESYKFVKKLLEKVEHFAIQIRNYNAIDFWKEADTSQIEKEITRRIYQIDKEKLNNGLRAGMDVEGNLSRLPSIVEEKVVLTLLLREKLTEVIESHFVQRLNKLLLELTEVNKEYLPDAVLAKLTDRLGNRDIVMRLNGLADSLFYDYGEKLERISLSLTECQGNSLEERTQAALDKYKDELVKFMKELVSDLNKYVGRSVKNHAEYLDKALQQLLEESRDAITTQISGKVKISDAVALETQKRTAVNNGYTAIVNLTKDL